MKLLFDTTIRRAETTAAPTLKRFSKEAEKNSQLRNETSVPFAPA